MCSNWQRPNTLPYPHEWNQVLGRNNSKSYKICDVRDEYHEEIIQGMIHHFINEEPTCKYLKCGQDLDFINELKDVWKSCLDENLSLMCVTEENGKESLAGFLLLSCCNKNDIEFKPSNEKWKKICNLVSYGYTQKEPFKFFNISNFLSDLGLLVFPQHRQQGLGRKILETCADFCKLLQLQVVIISCTGRESQIIAKQANYNEFYSISYKELKGIDNEKYGIDGISDEVEKIVYMYKSFNI